MSKELTLLVVYDVLRLTPFYKAFLVTADVPEIYMQEFWTTATGDAAYMSKNPYQTFGELSFGEEILVSLRYLGYSGEIKKITDNVDFAYLLWEDFVYQVENKDAKKSNEMYYPRFTKVIINFFMTKDPLIPRRNMFSAMLPVKLTNEDIRNSASYKEYYAIASGATHPKTKASVRKTQSSSDTIMPHPIAASTRLSTLAKGKQPAKSSKAKGLYVLFEVAMTETEQMKLATKRNLQQTHISQASGSGADEGTDNDGDDFIHPKLSTHDEEAKDSESFDPIVQTPSHVEDSYDESNDDESHGMNSSFVSSQFVTSMFNPSPDVGIDSIFELTPLVDVPVTTIVLPLLVTTPTLPLPSIPIMSQFAKAVSSILKIVDRYTDHRMNEAVKVAVQLQSDGLQDEAQAKNEDFINKLDENIHKMIKEQVKVQVSKILPKIEKSVKEQLEDEVLTRSSNSSKMSYAIILNTYGDKVTLKKRRDDAYKNEKPSVGSDRGSKRRREGKKKKSTNAPKEKESKTTGKSTEGSKSHQKTASESAPAEEPMQTTQDLEDPSHQEFETGAADDQPIAEAFQHPEWFQKQTKPPTPDRAWNKTLPAIHRSIQPWISYLANQAGSRASFNELMDTLVDFSAFLMNRLNVDTLTLEFAS
nr:hypothetical protein [Tanacetum cinerariifolium]